MKSIHTPEQKATLSKTIQLLEIFRSLDPTTEITLGEVTSLIHIAIAEQRDGSSVTITELADKAGVSLASSSRYVKALSTEDRQGRKGLGLVSAVRDPLSDRRKIVTLTPDGTKVLAKVIKIMENK